MSQLLDYLSDEEKGLLASVCTAKGYKAGQQIVCEGESGETLLLVRSGRVEARKNLAAEEYKYLKIIESGGFFGEMSFLNQSPRSATVVALEDCQVLEISRKQFDPLAQTNPELGTKIYREVGCELASRLQQCDEDLKKAVLWAMKDRG